MLDRLAQLAIEDAQGRIDLLSDVPLDELLGVNLAVQRIPTTGGLLSFALRWHGERPALLWEFSGGAGAELTVSALSSDVVPTQANGEVLLRR